LPTATSYLDEVKDKIAQSVKFDQSKYHLEYAGQFEKEERAQRRFTLILGLVLAVMLLLLYTEFGRLRQAVLILAVVPLATLGGLTALFVTGETLNIASAVGFIALFGVAVQNGIIMVANLNRVHETGVELREAVLTGAMERFRPVLMTATVATIGMMPAALATGVGSDVQRGVATVVVGGLIVATLLTLFVVPSFYYSLERIAERWTTRRQPTVESAPSTVTRWRSNPAIAQLWQLTGKCRVFCAITGPGNSANVQLGVSWPSAGRKIIEAGWVSRSETSMASRVARRRHRSLAQDGEPCW
jgi:cobalt-zinc-cadmium resistance protein CzcA